MDPPWPGYNSATVVLFATGKPRQAAVDLRWRAMAVAVAVVRELIPAASVCPFRQRFRAELFSPGIKPRRP